MPLESLQGMSYKNIKSNDHIFECNIVITKIKG